MLDTYTTLELLEVTKQLDLKVKSTEVKPRIMQCIAEELDASALPEEPAAEADEDGNRLSLSDE